MSSAPYQLLGLDFKPVRCFSLCHEPAAQREHSYPKILRSEVAAAQTAQWDCRHWVQGEPLPLRSVCSSSLANALWSVPWNFSFHLLPRVLVLYQQNLGPGGRASISPSSYGLCPQWEEVSRLAHLQPSKEPPAQAMGRRVQRFIQ